MNADRVVVSFPIAQRAAPLLMASSPVTNAAAVQASALVPASPPALISEDAGYAGRALF
jgi:hypothetical protein